MAATRTPGPRPCTTGQYLEVSNQTSEALEVYAVKGTQKISLGSAGPGETQFTLPNNSAEGLSFVLNRTSNNRPIVAAYGGQSAAKSVGSSVKCRGI